MLLLMWIASLFNLGPFKNTPLDINGAIVLFVIGIVSVIAVIFLVNGRSFKFFRQKSGYSNIKYILANNTPSDVSVSGIVMDKGEKAYFLYPGSLMKASIKSIGSDWISKGARASFGGGFSISKTGGTSITRRGRVEDLYNGIVVFTSKKILFLSADAGFSKDISKIDSMHYYGDNGLSCICNGKAITFIFDHPNVAKAAGKMLNRAIKDSVSSSIKYKNTGMISSLQDKNTSSANKPKKNYSPALEIQRLKQLLDSGVITRTEFESQKLKVMEIEHPVGDSRINLELDENNNINNENLNRIFLDENAKKNSLNGVDRSFFIEVAETVIRYNSCSSKMLQDLYKIPAGASNKLIRMMEEMGIIEAIDSESYKPLITIYELRKGDILNNYNNR